MIPDQYRNARPSASVWQRFLDHMTAHEYTLATFTGKTGTGKTHDACGIALAAARAGRYAEFSDSDSLGYGFDLERLKSPLLVIVDDVGARASEFVQANLLSLINARMASGKVTVITGNIDHTTPLDERILSRLRGGLVIAYDNRDLRVSKSYPETADAEWPRPDVDWSIPLDQRTPEQQAETWRLILEREEQRDQAMRAERQRLVEQRKADGTYEAWKQSLLTKLGRIN
jgi:hypothetical protein